MQVPPSTLADESDEMLATLIDILQEQAEEAKRG
ncbi:hypothetical protein PBI_JEANIE_13 [Gordonia phage Jeanie]|uniref:Uncharacterized protein n=2 Tax=root TaxID=1 RepID=A0A160DHQ3_9CAUD|nr:hypothetical protein BH764_gp13 [Gordonia phage McGonagall]ANA87591.1 hypothetical protein MCGONAGALL_13 [Gordonia phage McGonagall]ANA87618.1 hypothetical protein PBI_JEANIE_13 [Gordonia phage Jeanie]EGD53212.1 hypothetical protein SCNU_20032 [Gordonia neofelifaecis NRRL B-59395]